MRWEKIRTFRLPLSIKIIAIPIWVFGTLTFLFVSYFAIQKALLPVIFEQPTAAPSYKLFAAVPRESKQKVLWQQVSYSDVRILKLKAFFTYYNSPLAHEAHHLVEAADRYSLPWTLLAAIACKESGCARILPYGSHNAWGWAIYSGQNSGAAWATWRDAIFTVSKGLREDYFDNGYDTISKIETRYTPQSAATHHGWRTHVEYFTQELESWEI